VKNARILVVEDEAIVAVSLKVTLERLGYEVVGVAARGEEAIALAGALLPDLVLMDIHLPGSVDGIDAAAAIRRNRDTAVVFLTASSDASAVRRCGGVRRVGFLRKPIYDSEIEAAIEAALNERPPS
jgi:CheY-like chemotaxis protein